MIRLYLCSEKGREETTKRKRERERERESVCVCEREKEGGREREREREREKGEGRRKIAHSLTIFLVMSWLFCKLSWMEV